MIKRNFKSFIWLLFAVGAILFSACEAPSEDTLVPAPFLAFEDFTVSTLRPEFHEGQVLLKGNFEVDEKKIDQELIWGFLWMKAGEDRNSDMRRINVGRCYKPGDFKRYVDSLPRDEDIVVCAFVEARLNGEAEVTPVVGDEVEFAF